MDRRQTPHRSARSTPKRDNRHVLDVVCQAERELRQLIEERSKVTKRICKLKKTIAGLADLFGDGILDAALLDLFDRRSGSRISGITPACRRILMEAGRPMGARDVCDEIQRTLPALLAHHKDPMATINTILGRLVYYGDATGLLRDRGQRAWLWAAGDKNRLTTSDAEGSRPAK